MTQFTPLQFTALFTSSPTANGLAVRQTASASEFYSSLATGQLLCLPLGTQLVFTNLLHPQPVAAVAFPSTPPTLHSPSAFGGGTTANTTANSFAAGSFEGPPPRLTNSSLPRDRRRHQLPQFVDSSHRPTIHKLTTNVASEEHFPSTCRRSNSSARLSTRQRLVKLHRPPRFLTTRAHKSRPATFTTQEHTRRVLCNSNILAPTPFTAIPTLHGARSGYSRRRRRFPRLSNDVLH
jgi:hypothetical protein